MASGVKVPEWLLERLAAGELAPARAEALRQRLRSECDEHRLSAIESSNAEILAALPPTQVAREIERRAAMANPSGRRPRLVRPAWATAMVAACAASIAIVAAVYRSEPYDGIRGPDRKPTLHIYRQTKSGPDLLAPNAQVRTGDALQIRYLAAGRRYGVIASIDGRGTITFHLPESPGQAAALARDGERALVHSYELDDSPKYERFLFVASDVPFSTEEVARSLRDGTKLPPPLVSFEFSLRKSP
jgi:hypothetical protein